MFYQAVSRGLVEKTEKEYKQTIGRLLVKMRKEGHLNYGWIADGTRWMRKPRTHTGLKNALEDTLRYYRRDVWQDQGVYVEVWCEKEAMAGVLYEETYKWDVPLFVTRGFSSITFLHSAAQEINATEKPTYLYYLGDHDPSGLGISQQVEAGLRQHVSKHIPIHFERICITPEQIEQYQLPTRPTKQTDSRAKGFKGDSVELDAMPARILRGLVANAIVQHIDDDAKEQTMQIEQLERQTLENVLLHLPEAVS